jgi:hypothetical protein
MPISRSWVEAEVSVLTGQDRAMARLALVLAKRLIRWVKHAGAIYHVSVGNDDVVRFLG